MRHVWALLVLALAARLWLAAAQDLTRTETWSVGRATSACPSAAAVVGTARSEDVHPPLYYLGLWALEKGIGLHVFPLKASHALVAVLSIAVIWAWVREAAGSGSAFWSAILAAASGYHLMLSVQMRMYMLDLLWAAVAGWTAWRYWHLGRTGPGTLALHAAALVAALHTHYYAAFAWAAILAATAPESLRFSSRRKPWWTAHAAVLAAWLPWAVWGLGHQLAEGRTATVPEHGGWIASLRDAPLQFFVMNVRFSSPGLAAAAALSVAAGYAGTLAVSRRRGPPATTAGGSWMLFLALLAVVPMWLAAAYSLWRRPIWGIHYASVCFPAVCALVGTGLARLPRPAALLSGICVVAAGIAALPAIAAQGSPAYRASARLFLAEGRAEDAVVVNAMPHSGEGFLHFLRAGGGEGRFPAIFSVHEDPTYDDVPWLTRWDAWRDPAAAAGEAVEKIRAMRRRHRRVWFMNFSHAQGAFAELERRIAAEFPCRILDSGSARFFILEETADGAR